MRIILALICFIAMFMHAFFGYYLYVRGESVFEPDNMIVAVQKKVAVNTNKLSIFQKKSDHIDDPVVKEQAKNAAFYEKPDDGLVKTEERTEQEGAKTELNVSPNSSSSSSVCSHSSRLCSRSTRSGTTVPTTRHLFRLVRSLTGTSAGPTDSSASFRVGSSSTSSDGRSRSTSTVP